MYPFCSLCKEEILDNVNILTCTVCSLSFHKECLPNVSQENFEFTSKWICIICSVKIFPFNHIVSDLQFNECISESLESAQHQN